MLLLQCVCAEEAVSEDSDTKDAEAVLLALYLVSH